jgi:p-hydroxybenzoate 3-monooxygenase
MRTQVGIVGAGPAGLLLAHLLHRAGIASVVIENQTRRHVEERVRAGVLEQGTVDVLNGSGVGDRLRREGLVHHGIELRFAGESHRIALTDLTGRSITVYGQQEVVKDLIAARLAAGGEIHFEVSAVKLSGLESTAPQLRFTHQGRAQVVDCDFIAGCDGFHGVSRPSVPAGALAEFSRNYPFAWLGILAAAPPTSPELIYAYHENGFALYSMRSPAITRLYLQCAPDEDLSRWNEARIWGELHARLETGGAWALAEGEILQKGVTPMRSYVAEPMRFGRLFLAGDAAHIVPPTGAKGMNLAVNDVRVLTEVLASFYAGRKEALDEYSPRCLERVWRAEHFSWWMTSMLHRAGPDDPFHEKLQLAQLKYVTSSKAAAASLAENYVGLPFNPGASP